ncbi:MAG: arylsulfatase [Armatimonadetes bacterium]|nr:arylsulfatase [Armatimonadota bacterium]
MDRRELLRTSLAGSALAVARAFGQPPEAPAGPPAAPPNIVFILFDDLGYGEPPSFRAESRFKMPTLDRLTREGMRFTDAHTAAAVCTPTRYGVLTGRYPMRIGQFGVLKTFSAPIIEAERLTVPALLRQQGYHTAAFGKWHLGMNRAVPASVKASEKALPVGTTAGDGPTARGFDTFCGYTHSGNIGMVIEQDRVAANLPPVEVQPWLAGRTVDYIDQRAKTGQPFFLYVPLSTPHLPIVPAPEYKGTTGVSEYADWIAEGDGVTGRILDALERNELADNTLVIVTSDNGAEQRVYPPLRGSKRSIYEGGHRVPFIARWPGKIKPGATCADVVCLNDLMATAAQVTGARLPDGAGVDSVSLLPDLLGTAQAPVREATVHQSSAGDLAIRQGPWKLIFAVSGARELYNLADDLSETKDVLVRYPDVAARLTTLMRQYIANGRSTPGPNQANAYTPRLRDADDAAGKPGRRAGRARP